MENWQESKILDGPEELNFFFSLSKESNACEACCKTNGIISGKAARKRFKGKKSVEGFKASDEIQ